METPDSEPDRYAVVGHPVEHSRSAVIHKFFARQTGQHITYELIDAAPAYFETAVRGFGAAGGKGLNITIPHKEAAFGIATELGPEAKRAQAVNTLTFLSNTRYRGDNTDGIGLLRDLTVNHGQEVAAKRILILGAGGAARGIVTPLLDLGPAELVLANRTLARAETLVAELELGGQVETCDFDALANRAPFDLLINATSAGLRGEQPPFPASCLGPGSFCYDLVYGLKDTPFVLWSREHGAGTAVPGWGMLVEQAAESFLIWRGVRPDTAPILEQIST